MPWLLLHGTNDTTVPHDSSIDLHTAAANVLPHIGLQLLYGATHMEPVLALMDASHPLHSFVIKCIVT